MAEAQETPLLPHAAPWLAPDWVFKFGSVSYYVLRRSNLIRMAEADGIPHVAPILCVFNGDPQEVKGRIGKGLWKRVHHSTLEHNVWRARAKLLTKLDFPTIMAIPPGALSETVGQCKASGASAVAVAAHIATNRNEMREAVMLARDAIRMGGALNAAWSLRRLREEHDRLARQFACRTSNPAPFADPWEASVAGFHFRRLISEADFITEGCEMHHCIGSYAYRAREGRETAFSITGPERASVSFSRGGYVEIKGRYNWAVSKACRDAASEAWKRFKARPSPDTTERPDA